jgi:hypothetical protein
MQHWHEVEDWLRDVAHEDVLETGGIRPTLVAFAGARPLLMARWRAFERGGGHAALIELLTLAMPMGADRLAVSIGGNGWSYARERSTDWPYPRDDRRQILMTAVVDGTTAGGRPRCTLTPFEHRDSTVQWGDPLVSDEVEGWLVDMLSTPHEAVPSVPATVEDLTATAMRCIAQGHELYYPCVESDARVTPPEARAERARRSA